MKKNYNRVNNIAKKNKMKEFQLLVLCLFLLTACQQQQVPEITYDLDAKSLLAGQTRAVQRNILYQELEEPSKRNLTKSFAGTILDIKVLSDDNITLKLLGDNGSELIFNTDATLLSRIDQDMYLEVRYRMEAQEVHVLEIRKNV